MFKDVFGTNPRTKILDFLCDHPECCYTTQEISNKAKVVYTTTRLHLNALHKLGIVNRSVTKKYRLNMSNKYIISMIKCDLNEM